MTHDALDSMLAHSKENKARCEYLETVIAKLQEILRTARMTMKADAANGVQVLTGMPHGSGTSDPTGRFGMLFAEGWMPDDLREVDQEIRLYQEEYRYKITPVRLVEAILDGLTDKERMIVYGKDIDGKTWRELGMVYNAQYGYEASTSAMKRMFKAAKQKLYRIAE